MMDETADRRTAGEDRRSDAYVLGVLLAEAKNEVVRVRTELVVARAERDYYRAAIERARDLCDADAPIFAVYAEIVQALEKGAR